MSIFDVTVTQYLNIPNLRPEKGGIGPLGRKAPSWEWSLQTCDGPWYRLTRNDSEKNLAENILRPGPGSRPNCNALGTSAVNITRLQRIHNTAARLIMRSPRSDSATPLLRELHWLSIVCRVDFKLLVFTYNAMHNDAPVDLCEFECPYQPTRTLRSANNNKTEVRATRTKAGDCSFAVAAASLWNNLPTFIKTCDNLTSFKGLLKLSYSLLV